MRGISCLDSDANRNPNRIQSTFRSTAVTSERKRPNQLTQRIMLLARSIKRIFNRRNLLGFLSSFSLMALIFMMPLQSNAATLRNTSSNCNSPVEYYLQNDPSHYTPSGSEKTVISIHTQSPSTLSSSPAKYSKEIQNPRNYGRNTIRRHKSGTQRVHRIALGFVATSLAAASFRASLRKSKIVRNITPFGIIRNASPLGNGVSVIQLRMALQFSPGDADDGANDCKSFLERLHLEEYNLYASISMLAQQQLRGADVYRDRQKALVKYITNVGIHLDSHCDLLDVTIKQVASVLLVYKHAIKYGSMASNRVPFVEEAINEFRSICKQERLLFDEATKKMTLLRVDDKTSGKISDLSRGEKQFVIASIVLAIKGDHTSGPFQFGVSSRKDMGRILSRIVSDAQVENCLVGTEVMWIPRELIMDPTGGALKASDILMMFPDVATLS
ncbi:hypothetical protein ACHAWX_004340 [Stephanocyclus meneghinianus]